VTSAPPLKGAVGFSRMMAQMLFVTMTILKFSTRIYILIAASLRTFFSEEKNVIQLHVSRACSLHVSSQLVSAAITVFLMLIAMPQKTTMAQLKKHALQETKQNQITTCAKTLDSVRTAKTLS
jgi:hypothetical protein